MCTEERILATKGTIRAIKPSRATHQRELSKKERDERIKELQGKIERGEKLFS